MRILNALCIWRSSGLTEQKKRETYERIAEVGLALFLEHGFESTTIDEIAEGAGISRRTFFYYFKSKEDLLFDQTGSGVSESLHAAILEESVQQASLVAVANSLTKLATRYESPTSIAFDALMRSTEALGERKEPHNLELERVLCNAMDEYGKRMANTPRVLPLHS